jgi:DNA-binding Xre family transcriptional regulator
MDDKLQAAITLTDEIVRVESELASLREDRKKLMIELREGKVTARVLSDCLGMSEQNVHKIVKGK